jgi:hypothetical protein
MNKNDSAAVRIGRSLMTGMAVCGLAMLQAPTALASDHIDFPDCSADLCAGIEPATDLTDLMAWVPAPGRLALTMSVHINAQPASRFSDAVDYRFRIRRVQVSQGSNGINTPMPTPDPEIGISCRVDGRQAVCVSGSHTASVALDQVAGGGTDALRIFAGLRADSFFLDFKAAAATLGQQPKTGQPKMMMPLANPQNFSAQTGLTGNVLSVIVDLDVNEILGEDTALIAVSSEVVVRSDAGNGQRIDRAGRPEITNMTIRKSKFKMAYNQADTFALEPTQNELFQKLIGAGVKFWDGLDGSEQWTPDALKALTGVLVNDYLVVDTGKVCSVNDRTYLDIERAAAGQSPSCGGRTPNADIIDTMVSVYTGGVGAGRDDQGDGVDNPSRAASDAFPYLPAPHAGDAGDAG